MTITGIGVSGTVTVTVTDESSDQDSDSKSYNLNAALSATGNWNATCDGEVQFSINASGGSPPYTYEIKVNGNVVSTSSSYLYNAGWGQSGTWSWTVTDACSNDDSGGSAWSTPQQLTVTASTVDEDHCSGEVSASANVSGGTGPYTIDWDIDNDGSYDVTNGGTSRTFYVGYGVNDSFKVRVTDSCGNQVFDTDSYSINSQLEVEITSASVNCAHNQVTFDAGATGGSGNYSYAWCADGDGQYNDGTGTRFVLSCGVNQQGTVSVRVTDTAGCTDTDSQSYDTSYTPLNTSGSWTINCDGNLILTINVIGGSPNYTYEFDYDDNGSVDYTTTTPNTSVTHTFPVGWNSSGQWSWKVTDNCSEYDEGGPVNWQVPAQIDVQIIDAEIDHCAGTAQFFAQASGGSGNYRYDWDLDGNGSYEVTNGGTTQTISGYGISGRVNVMVTDTTYGCTDTDQESYEINPQLVVNLGVVVSHCDAEAVFTAVGSGGDGNYTYDWDLDGNGSYEVMNGGTTKTIEGVGESGKVNVRVNDSYCSSTDFVNFAINSELAMDLDVRYGDGVAIFTAEGQGGGEGYVYDWDMDNDGTYEVLDGGQEQRIHGYNEQGTVNARVTDACLNQVEKSIQYDIPEEAAVDPPTEVPVKGIFELDGTTPHMGSASYLVMWYPDELADSYTLQESTTEDFSTITNEFLTTSTRKKITNMADGVYYYRVMGCNEVGCTPWSDTMTAAVGVTTEAPNSPTALRATALSEDSIQLDWNDNSDNEDGFKLYRNGTEIADLPAGAVSYTDTGLVCSTSYTYVARAYNTSGLSPVSNMTTGTTEDCDVAPTPPSSPTDVGAVGVSETEVEVSWTDTSDNETGFRIFRDGAQIADIPTNMTTYTDAGLECGTDHSYYVVSYNASGQSGPSGTASAATLQCQPETTLPPSGNYMQATLQSPAYLHAIDAEGRHIGRIGEDLVEIGIPGGTYSGLDSHPQVITVYNPQSEIQFYFEAYEEGTVTLNVEASENGEVKTYAFKDLSVMNGTVFLVNAGASTGQLDLDGDGQYEQEISGILITDEEGDDKTIMYVAFVAVIILIALAAMYLTRKKE